MTAYIFRKKIKTLQSLKWSLNPIYQNSFELSFLLLILILKKIKTQHAIPDFKSLYIYFYIFTYNILYIDIYFAVFY